MHRADACNRCTTTTTMDDGFMENYDFHKQLLGSTGAVAQLNAPRCAHRCARCIRVGMQDNDDDEDDDDMQPSLFRAKVDPFFPRKCHKTEQSVGATRDPHYGTHCVSSSRTGNGIKSHQKQHKSNVLIYALASL